MPMLALVAALFVAPPQNQAANAACSILTGAEAASIIGAAKVLPVTSSATGATCMFQNGDAVITVLAVKQADADGAQGLFNSKKRIVAGADVPGWSAPAYAGAMGQAAVVGVVKGVSFVEVKVIDKTQKVEALSAKLQAVMKAVAGRL